MKFIDKDIFLLLKLLKPHSMFLIKFKFEICLFKKFIKYLINKMIIKVIIIIE